MSRPAFIRSLPIIVLHLVVAASCALPPSAPGGSGMLVTDRSSYTATYEGGAAPYQRYGLTIVAQFTNATASPVYLSRCYPNSLHPVFEVMLVNGDASHRSAYEMAWACVGHDHQIVVAPGEVRTDTLRVSGPNARNGLTNEAYGTLSGRMQLRYESASCEADTGCLAPPPPARFSNEFQVTQQP